MTSDEALAARIFMIANHGQECKYQHRRIGCNSRLDTLQAAVLDVKLKHLEEFTEARRSVARQYDEALSSCDSLVIPAKSTFSTHVYHQYTIQVKGGRRNALQHLLKEQGIPSMIYYPLPCTVRKLTVRSPVYPAIWTSPSVCANPSFPCPFIRKCPSDNSNI